MKLLPFILGLIGPLMTRVLAALGMSLLSITGLTVATSTIKGLVTAGLGSMPVSALMFAGLCGVWTVLGIWLGAVTFVVTWQTTKGFTALVRPS